jgi:hypothetical protein
MVGLSIWVDMNKNTKVYGGHGIFKSFFFPTPNQIICNRPSAGLSQPWLVELTFWKLASGEQGAGSPVSGSNVIHNLALKLKALHNWVWSRKEGGSKMASDSHLSGESCLCVS